MPQRGSAVLIALCLIAGFAALAGMSSVLAVLVLGLGTFGLFAAAASGLVAMVAGLWAAVIGLSPRASDLVRPA
jgi:threonine dehydrogenase-like Zn-dependent dehydrogenase